MQLVGGLLFLALGMTSACSLVYDLSADQCELDGDCVVKGLGNKCVAGVCDPSSSSTGGMGAGGGSGGDGGKGGCTSNAECLDAPDRLGLTACLQGACVKLTNDTTCPSVLPSDELKLEQQLRETAEPIVLGAFAPLFPPQRESPFSHNFDLAFTAFNKETAGGVSVSGGQRALIAVLCETPLDGEAGPYPIEQYHESLDHLVDTLKVPGIVAAMYAPELKSGFDYKRTNTSADPMWISSLDSDSLLVAKPDNGLIWQMMPTGEEVALPVKPLLTRVLDAKALEEPARVALIVDRDIQSCIDMSSTILDKDNGIEFNGEIAIDQTEDTFRTFSTHTTDAPGDLVGVVQDLLEFQPHVILAMTDLAFYNQIFTPLENQWSDATDDAPKPFYIVSPFHFSARGLGPSLNRYKTRMAGINAAASTDRVLVNTYLNLYRSEFQGEESYEGFENFYDAPYFLIYAAAAAAPVASQQLRGQDLVDGMKRLVDMDARQYRLGISKIPATLQALAIGNIRLDGTMGPPEFNANTGSRTTPGSVWCATDTSTQPLITDVLLYKDGALELGVDLANGVQLEELPCAAEF
ncbi:MAG: hypothetical protein M3020_23285 [Myxococcota bacterium]|nr:hypothetical protein [Myxococcota bacterium]